MTAALPTPRTPDPMLAPSLRWGVIGSGWIVDRFVTTVRENTTQQVVALGSRDGARARAVADRLGIPTAYGSYQELAADPRVDIVYVATGHADHLPCARISLAAGKHTLVEKPLAINAFEAKELVALAREKGVFCAEALWSFFLPRYDVVRQILEQGLLGDVHTVLADNGEAFAPDHRILRADALGGPMLDLGTYPISLATWVLGAPRSVVAARRPHPAGVTGQVGAVLGDVSGNQAVVHASVLGDTPVTASIAGSKGFLFLPGPFYQPGDVLLTLHGASTVVHTEPRIGHRGLFYEAAEVARCVAAGLAETPLRPLADSITTLRAMDAVQQCCTDR